MILNDRQIAGLCAGDKPMISPFEPTLVKELANKKVISYGLSSFGYDIRLANEPLIYLPPKDSVIDVKNPDTLADCEHLESREDSSGVYFILQPFSKVLGVSLERFIMPAENISICTGKSSYARVGINPLVTPLEPGWCGYLTLEIFNLEARPNKLYANEGIVQILFLKGDRPSITYSDRSGKYQDQRRVPILPR